MNNLPRYESGPEDYGLFVLRAVIDVVQQCNLHCLYCHPGEVWVKQHLPATALRKLFLAAEEQGLLEVVLTGGEITIHPEFEGILDATHAMQKVSSTFVTNATMLTPVLIDKIAKSNITRICMSLDSAEPEAHNSARGNNFEKVMRGLQLLQTAGREITVISVVHQKNFRNLLELSYMLVENKLANQHHMCAPSFSGLAREHYDELKLKYEDYILLGELLDKSYKDLKSKGLHVAFNSYWPATGRRLAIDSERKYTLQNLVEQTKDSYVIVRSSGDFRLTHAAWGRETVGNAIIGNIQTDEGRDLFLMAERLYREGSIKQLPREIEAQHKFQLGVEASTAATNVLIGKPSTVNPVEGSSDQASMWIPIVPLSKSSMFASPLSQSQLFTITRDTQAEPSRYRFIKQGSGVYLIFDRVKSHVTLLTENEWNQFATIYSKFSQEPII